MTNRKGAVAVGAAIMLWPALGLPQTNIMTDCGCDKLVGSSLLTVRTTASSGARATLEQDFYCHAREEAVREVYESSTNVGVGLPDFLSADLKSKWSSEGLRVFRESYCRQRQTSDSWRSITSSFERFAPPQLIEAVNKCTQSCKDQGGVYCDLRPLDTESLTLFVRYRPRGEYSKAFLDALKVVGGRLVVSDDIGGKPALSKGQAILPGGISVPIRRNTPLSDVRALVNTSQGNCEADQPAVSTEYEVKARIVAYGKVVAPVRETFRSADHNTHPDCGREMSGAETFCLADSRATATSIGNFSEVSGNCERSATSGAVGSPSQNCASANWRIKGCGYTDYGVAKDCKGNGWITYHATVTGEVLSDAPASTFERTDVLRLGSGEVGSLTYQFPMDQIGAWRNKTLLMEVSIAKMRHGRPAGTISLNAQQVAVGGATLSFNPQTGQGGLTVKNEDGTP